MKLTYPFLVRRFNSLKFLIKMYAKTLFGKDVRVYSEDRRILEQVIFPHYLSKESVRKVLFVGCAPYTAHYPNIWKSVEYWTIEINPRLKRYGSRNHVVDSIENLRKHFDRDYFDLIICNGVYGYGVNTKPVCERAFQACYETLREGGELILGWDQLPEFSPVPLSEIRSLGQFQPNHDSVLGDWRVLCEHYMLHTYDFYVKPASRHEMLEQD